MRETTHAREMEIDRRQNAVSFSEQQLVGLGARSHEMADEVAAIEAKRGPAHQALAERRDAAEQARQARERAAVVLSSEGAAYDAAYGALQALEAEVEEKRQAVYLSMTAISSLEHAIGNAEASRQRVEDELARLDAERSDVEVEDRRLQVGFEDGRRQVLDARSALERVRADGETRQAELAEAREEQEQRRQTTRTREQELASVEARLQSLEELEAARAQYGDAARFLLADGDARLRHFGSLADHLDVLGRSVLALALAQALDEAPRAGAGDRADVLVDLRLVHADPVVRNGQRPCLGIDVQPDLQFFTG